ncbi:MAG: hypothetical protein VX705_09070 [Verrucomicrobiota bacterium]|nr:hypothetical protein [Verrucomicrobiota bacterium]
MRRMQTTGLAVLLAVAAGCSSVDEADWGPVYAEFQMVSEPDTLRREVMGPLFGYEKGRDYTRWTLAPLLSFWRSVDGNSTEFDLLHPLLTYNRTGTESRTQLLQLLSLSGGRHQSGADEHRTTILPFYLARRSGDSERDYTAVFPFYGTIKNRLLRDEIRFRMFPLYARSKKRDITTWNYLYPFFHWRTGANSLRGWQIWPLLGHETREAGGKRGGHRHFFFAWPFYHNRVDGIGTDNHRTHNALLPLYSISRSAKRNDTRVLWPFFNYSTDRENDYWEYSGPWPFIAYGQGPKKSVRRVWPFYGRSTTEEMDRQFYLWPLYQRRQLDTELLERDRKRFLNFLYSHTHELHKETGLIEDRADFWPIFTHQRDSDGRERLVLLSPIEPFLPGSVAARRIYSPLFAVWRSRSDARTGRTSKSFLWNLVRCETAPDSEKCSLLFGLFRYKKQREDKEWRLLWVIPIRSNATP